MSATVLGPASQSIMRLTLVRHAFAGHKRDWNGPHLERPLDQRAASGQAFGLSTVLAGYKVRRIELLSNGAAIGRAARS